MSQALSLDVVLNAIDRASAPLRNINNASSRTAEQFKNARTQLKQLHRQQKDIRSFRALQKASKLVKTEFAQATERSNQLSRQLAQTSNPTRKLLRDFDRARAATQKLRQQHINHLQTLRSARNALQQTGVNTRNLASEQRQLTRDIEASDRALQGHQRQLDATRRRQERLNRARQRFQNTRGMAGNMSGAGMTGVAGGTATLLAVAKTASVGMEFDAQMSKVQALTRLEKNSNELAELRKQARQLGANTMFSATETAKGQGFLAMAGFSSKDIINSMPGILSTAAAAGVEIATAADIGSNILSSFNMKASEMGRVGDVLTSAFTKGNVDLMMLGETMKYVAPVAEGLGVKIETVAAMTSILGSNGVQASMAGTSQKAILNRLAGGPKMARKALASLNIKTVDEDGNLVDIVKLLANIEKATKKMGKAERQSAYTKIAGMEAVSSLMILTKKAFSGELGSLTTAIDNDYGISNKTAAVMGDNATGDLKELVSSIQDVAIEITSLNNESLRELIQNITQVTRGIGAWIRLNPELTATITRVITIGGALFLGLGLVALAASALLLPFALLSFGLTVLTAPVLGVIAAFVALSALIYKIYQNWDKINNWLTDKLGTGAAKKIVNIATPNRGHNLDMGMRNNRPIKPVEKINQQLKNKANQPVLIDNRQPTRKHNLDMGMRNNRPMQKPLIDNQPTLINRPKSDPVTPLSIDNITINAAPGMDEKEVARLVTQEITRQQNQARTGQRSQFQDTD